MTILLQLVSSTIGSHEISLISTCSSTFIWTLYSLCSGKSMLQLLSLNRGVRVTPLYNLHPRATMLKLLNLHSEVHILPLLNMCSKASILHYWICFSFIAPASTIEPTLYSMHAESTIITLCSMCPIATELALCMFLSATILNFRAFLLQLVIWHSATQYHHYRAHEQVHASHTSWTCAQK